MLEKCRQRDLGKKRAEDKRNNKIEYNQYSFSIKERTFYLIEGILLIAAIGYFFYRSIQITIFLLPMLVVFMNRKKMELCQKRKLDLTNQFKDALNSIQNSIQAGYSMENAFLESYRDIVHEHGMESVMAKELFLIKMGLRNNQNLEEMLKDLGDRSGVEDIRDFADVLMIGKRSGGNLYEIMRTSISVIEEKIRTKQEIQTQISSRQFEVKIMNKIPFLIILYIDFSSNGYFDALYSTISGRIIMTGCLLVYFLAVYLSRKIIDIKI